MVADGRGQGVSPLLRLIFSIPVAGWLLGSAWYGDTREKAFFLANIAMIWALLVLNFGYPFLIVPALAFAGGYLAFLVFFTASDMRG